LISGKSAEEAKQLLLQFTREISVLNKLQQ